MCVSRKKIIRSLLRGVAQKADRVKSDGELLRGVAGAAARFTIEVDERTKSCGFATDDCDHQRESKNTGASEGGGGAADTHPNRQWVLQRARVDGLPGEWRTVFARPMDMRVLANFEEQIELFRKKRVVVFKTQAEKRERLHNRAAAGDDLSTAIRDKVESGKFLEHPHRISGAEDRHSARKANVLRARGGGSQNHHRR